MPRKRCGLILLYKNGKFHRHTTKNLRTKNKIYNKASLAATKIFCAFFFIVTSTFFAQPSLAWSVTYNGSLNSWDESRLLYVDANGNSYVGSYSSTTTGGNDVTILKYNSSGSLVWTANQDGALTGNIDWANDLKVDAAGNIYIAGYNTDFSGTAVIVSFNSAGTLRWISHISAVFNDESFSLATDGIYVYACAHTFIWTGHFNDDYQTVKVDCATGTVQAGWPQTYNSVYNNQDWPTSIATINGKVFVTGTCNNGSNRDWMTIGYDASGNILPGWPQIYNGSGNGDDLPAQITITASGNVVITGYVTGAGTNWDMCTIMYTQAGATVAGWPQTYNGTANGWDGAGNTNNHSQVRCVTTDASNNVYVCGWAQNSGTGYDIVTVKYNSAGAVQAGWPKLYNQSGGDDIGRGIALDAGTDVFITGYTTNGGQQDIVTIQYDASGNVQTGWPQIWNGPAGQADEGLAISVVDQCVWVTGNAYNGSPDMATLNYCGVMILPVQFLDVKAQYNESLKKVNISWETAVETNNAYFLIERSSSDGITWNAIEKIKGAGNSDRIIKYDATDNNPQNGNLYYRIKQFDHNGRSSESEIRSVWIGSETGAVVFPNPCHEKFTLMINSSMGDDAKLLVYDVFGKIVYERLVSEIAVNIHSDKKTEIAVNLGPYPKGAYFYRVVSAEKTIASGKVILQ